MIFGITQYHTADYRPCVIFNNKNIVKY